MRAALAGLALLALLVGIAGAATLAVERRLAALAPGGLELVSLHYNPFSGRLLLTGVRGRDTAGRELFRADRVIARVSPFRLLGRPLTLSQALVTAPRLTLRAAAGFDLADLAAGLRAAPAAAGELPVRIEDLGVAGGSVVVEGAGEGGAPLLVRDLDVRLSRLTTATIGQHDVAFAVDMAVYGTVVYVTGQPYPGGYRLHVRARGLDVAGLVRDFPVAVLQGLEGGRGDVDADLLLTGGRLLASGSARMADVALTLPVRGRPRLRAAALASVLERFDLSSGAGRISRIELDAPTLSLPAAGAVTALAALVESLRSHPELIVRRIAITDGTLALDGGGARLEHVRLTADAPEVRASGWVVSARAGLGADGGIALDGVLSRDLRALDAVTRLRRVAAGPWRPLIGASAQWDARVSFDGRLRLAAVGDATAVTLDGHALLADVGAAEPGGFHADRVALGIRRLRWPGADAIIDSVVVTRPAFALPAATPWPQLVVIGSVSVVDGKLREATDGRSLRDLHVSLAPLGRTGARLLLSASTDGVHRTDVDRIVSYQAPAAGQAAPTEGGTPLGLLFGVIEEAARTVLSPATAVAVEAPPAGVLAP